MVDSRRARAAISRRQSVAGFVAEVDDSWNTFTEEGEASQCGWLKDKYGVSWQIVPTGLSALLRDPDRAKAGKVMRRLLEMTVARRFSE
jgi:predicted 3-demethylubiquinone-9 3-methyltransferase (glyoxalase superfamily)